MGSFDPLIGKSGCWLWVRCTVLCDHVLVSWPFNCFHSDVPVMRMRFGSADGVVVIGTTNRPDILDKADLSKGLKTQSKHCVKECGMCRLWPALEGKIFVETLFSSCDFLSGGPFWPAPPEYVETQHLSRQIYNHQAAHTLTNAIQNR